jgi:hypothetical protein
MYHGLLYFVWGPAPAIVLLVPLHLLGFEPSASVTVAVYSIAGLGFALAALRVLIRQLGEVPTWMCATAGLVLSLCSAIPFLLRTPSVSEDVIAGGYCFTMAGVWLAAVALVDRKASAVRLVLMSLCFGLAAGSRPLLGLVAVVLIPVYLRLRASRSRRSLVTLLGVPIAVCFVLLLAYNQARFHEPLEIGSRYQLSGIDVHDAPLGRLSYALPGAWLYASTPPQALVNFPFLAIHPPRTTSPAGLVASEVTGGLLPMTPIIAFVVALPWLWRRRPTVLGSLGVMLMAMACAGAAMMLIDSYEFFASTERYEVDFATLFVLAGLAGWLALATGPPSRMRTVLRVGGGLLAAWGCATGVATSFFGYGNYLQTKHPATWKTLEDIGSPLSMAIATVVGHPVLAASFASVNLGQTAYLLGANQEGPVTIISPTAQTATLTTKVLLYPGTHYQLGITGAGSANATYAVPAGGGTVELPVRLVAGSNRIGLYPVAVSAAEASATNEVMWVHDISIASRS